MTRLQAVTLRLSAALFLSLLTLFYPTHCWTPHFARLWPELTARQQVVGVTVQALGLPVSAFSLLRVPLMTGLDSSFTPELPAGMTRERLIVGHLSSGILVYSGLLWLPALWRTLRRRRAADRGPAG